MNFYKKIIHIGVITLDYIYLLASILFIASNDDSFADIFGTLFEGAVGEVSRRTMLQMSVSFGLWIFIGYCIYKLNKRVFSKIKNINSDKNITLYLKTSDIFSVYITAILGIILYIFPAALLYPLGYFADIIVYLLFLSIIGLFVVYKKPKIAKRLFVMNVIGVFLVIITYILTTSQDWTFFRFIFIYLTIPCLILLLPAYLLKDIK